MRIKTHLPPAILIQIVFLYNFNPLPGFEGHFIRVLGYEVV